MPFDNIDNEMSALTIDFKNDLGTKHEHESRKGSVETVLAFSKIMLQKTAQERRRKTHCNLLHCTLKINQTRKKITMNTLH